MILCLLFHGIVIVSLLLIFSKWLDDSLLIDICFYSLIVEIVISSFNVVYIYYSDFLFILNVGCLSEYKHFLQISLVFFFDEISNIFFFLLDFALVLCFYFLVEYFEYDFNSTGIILLSSLFSHMALWFFCVYDLFLLIFFWESISLISFFLIQYWSYRVPSYKAAIKVFFISQIGDLPFFFFFFFIIYRFNTTDIAEIQSQVFILSFEYIVFVKFNVIVNSCFFLSFLASFAVLLKSAQFFFYPWLLDAMEAPVPISAQLHSSTLVIIGFYVYFRFQNLIILSPSMSVIFLFFGISTIVYASVLGFYQEDGKKLLACSTASQLGYVITGLGLCYFEESVLMLIFCCCNKAITFIWFGILMDKYSGVSDFRIIGGVSVLSWLEHIGILVSLSNFTVVPGVFSWQLKSLYLKGQYQYDFFFLKYCFDIILLTWFFGSLYFFYLYISLFLKPCRLVYRNNKSFFFNNLKKSAKVLIFHNKLLFILITYLVLSCSLLFKFNFIKLFSSVLYKLYSSTRLLKYFIINIFWYNVFFFFLSWSFFFVLLLSFIFLLNFENYFFESIFDTSWINTFFFYYDFFFYDFYNF